MRIGHRGSKIRQLQERLVQAGYPVEVDGIFGPETDRAVRQFQRDMGLLVDGVAGPQTWAALVGELVESRPTPEERLKELWPVFVVAAKERKPHDPYVLAGIAMVETRMGTSPLLDGDYRGDGGHGHGLMQVDGRTWGKLFDPKFPKWWHSDVWSIATGAAILEDSYLYIQRKVQEQGIPATGDEIKWAAVAGYNCWAGRVPVLPVRFDDNPQLYLLEVSVMTTGGDYAYRVWKACKEVRKALAGSRRKA